MRRTLIASIALVMVGAACTNTHGVTRATRAMPTTSSVTRPAATTTTSPTDCAVPRRGAPDPNRPSYTLNVDVRPAERRVTGDVTVKFTPDITVDRLVFRLWANSPALANGGAQLSVRTVSVDGRAVTPALVNPTTLSVPLRAPVAAGQTVGSVLTWDLTLSGAINDRIAQVDDSIRLGSFFPILAWEPGVGWATEPPAAGFAEASTAATADFDMHVVVPAGLDVLASGVPDASGSRWHADAVRDVALSIGHFRVVRVDAVDGIRITIGVATSLGDLGDAYALKLKTRLGQYAIWFGPYAWSTYTVAITPALRGGIEYPTFVMQGPGTLGRTTSHELGHQWFYSLVGNDQARDPWLDEGLATYAEVRGEGTLGETVARPLPAAVRGHLTSPMSYWNDHQSTYYAGVYLQGARAVASLGPPDRVDCALRIYLARNAYRIAQPGDLIHAASEVFVDAPAKLAAFGVTSSP